MKAHNSKSTQAEYVMLEFLHIVGKKVYMLPGKQGLHQIQSLHQKLLTVTGKDNVEMTHALKYYV